MTDAVILVGGQGKRLGKITLKTPKPLLKIGNKYLLYEKRGKKLMTRAGFDTNKIFVIYNSLDYELQKEYFENYQECY